MCKSVQIKERCHSPLCCWVVEYKYNPNEAEAEDNTLFHFRYRTYPCHLRFRRKTKIIFIFTLNSFGYIQYKGQCTKRNAQVLCWKLQTWSFFPSCHIVQRWGFAFDRWKCIHELDPDTITHLLRMFGHIKRILIGHSRGHVITFFSLTKIDTAYPALKFLLNIYKIMSCSIYSQIAFWRIRKSCWGLWVVQF